ncbi:4Fe-4S dicluster domain-containing protein [Neorhizobium sp. NCHU2750]|uniref:4Fe-4S dicluster domain-containing protein n=1 Tax=Neorhizobium sp. NCHU2750 TaxID=1825976 RepID=UPI000E70EB36|nr:ferredoxin [Neorhizobium sp. NCHU2750]
MMGGPSSISREIETGLGPSGILIRGTVDFAMGEGPLLADGTNAASVVLLGNAGGSIWPAFSRWKAGYDGPDPLDTWSKEIIHPLAERLGGTAYFPSDPPWQPFQQWAMRAERLKPSPLGILIHPDYGLWHGYRGAIGFVQRLDDASASSITGRRHACDHCPAKPCLSTCPVSAIRPDPQNFAVSACRSHLLTLSGQGACMVSGCLARNACPVGEQYRYLSAQLEFHMHALR